MTLLGFPARIRSEANVMAECHLKLMLLLADFVWGTVLNFWLVDCQVS